MPKSAVPFLLAPALPLWQRRVEFPGMVAFMQAATPRSR